MSPEQWRAAGTLQTHAGRQLFVIRGGDAALPGLVLIHGFPTSSWDWAPVWPALTQHFHCLALDLLGFGWSDKPGGHDYSILEQADLVTHVARGNGLSSAHVLAHDYGDTVAQELLARHNMGADLALESLIWLNGGLFAERHRARFVQKLLNSPIGWLVTRAINRDRFARAMRGVCAPGTLDDALLDALWAIICHDDGHLLGHRLIRYIRDRRTHRSRWVGAMQQATIPLGVINGPIDPVSGAHMVQRYRELVPEPDVTLLEGIGHYPQLEAPGRVVEAVLDFHARRTGALAA